MAWFRFVNYHSSAKILICCLYRLYTWNHINSSLSTFYLYQNIIFAQFCQPGCLVRSPSDVERYLLLRGGNRRRKLAIRPCCAWKWCGGCPKQGYPQSSSVLDWDFPNKNHPFSGVSRNPHDNGNPHRASQAFLSWAQSAAGFRSPCAAAGWA